MPSLIKENFKKRPELMAGLIPIICFLLSIILYMIGNHLSQRAQIYLRETFDPVWIFIITGYIRPLLYIFGGWLFIGGLNSVC